MGDIDLQARAIFFDALERESPEQLRAYVDQACGDNAPLRVRVDELLRAHREAGKFLGGSAAAVGTIDRTVSEKPGSQIGPYKLMQQMGEGGMGVVFAAEQKDPVKRHVALKIIKPGMDTQQVIARFEAERQALALMDHPNIARVLDAGATDSGRPYFVMELVNGISVTEYCDQQHLTPRERLELFVPICQAVQHAHQKGIIHRDLKPSNVLVALYDGRPVPKVIDFGVAKATSQSLTEKTIFTQLGQIVGTLEYMSPEQAQRNQLDVDTRSDIYSLGVLLYELLTGDTPFDRQRLRSVAFDEMLRIIREEEPPRPSTKVSSSDSLPSIAANRHIEPQRLGNSIRGELDWIVMKALEKDRARRYASASNFAEDIQHFLNDESVVACPPSAMYRFRKFARRNKVAIAVVSLLTVSLLLGMAGTTWQAVRATQAEHRAKSMYEDAEAARQAESQHRKIAEQQREAAQLAQRRAADESAIATAISDFLQNDLLAQADPANEPDRDIKLRTVLNRAAARIAGRFSANPVVEAGIRDTLGRTYLGLGAYEEAGKHFERAVEIYRSEKGPDHRDTLASMNNLATFHEFQGHYDQAEPLFAEVLAITRRILGPEHSDTLICQNNLAWSLTMQGKYRDAEPLFKDVLDIRTRTLGGEHVDTLGSLNDLGALYHRQKKYELAQPLFAKALEIRRQTLGQNHPDTLTSMNNLAMLLKVARHFDEAEPLLREVLRIRRQILGDRHPQTILSINNLAFLLKAAGRPADAEPFYVEALNAASETLADEHPTTIDARNNLAALYEATNRSVEAERLLRTNLTVLQKSAPGSEGLHRTKYALGVCLMSQENYAAAEEMLLSACDGLQQRADGGSETVGDGLRRCVTKLVELYEATDKPQQAAEWRKKLQ